MNELEAKYLIAVGKKPSRVLRRVLQELTWAGYLAHPRGTSKILDTYYDTEDWHLRKAGWTYRIRKTDDTLRATLKQLANQRSNIFERQEIEQELYSPLEHPGQPPVGAVAEVLAGTIPGGAAVRVLFEQSNQRQRFHLSHGSHPHAQIELSLDQVSVDSVPSSTYAEIEFELHEGPVNALQDLTGVLERQPNLIPARVGKYQRGLLATDHQPPSNDVWRTRPEDIYGKWIDVALPHLNQLRLQFKQQEPFAWEGTHIEGVHQLRITTRRIRAGLQAFSNVLPGKRSKTLEADIRWMTSALGPVRDLDVHLERLRSYREFLAPPQRLALNRYQRHLERLRRDAHTDLLRALSGARFATLDEHFERVLDKATRRAGDWGLSTQQAATDQVLPLLESVLRSGGNIKTSSSHRKLHKVRIGIKRLRYQLEYLLAAYGKPARRAHRQLRKLQDSLGSHQDAVIALEQLQSYCHHTNLNRIERRTFKQLMATEQQRADDYRAEYPKRWSRFEKTALQLRTRL